MAFGPKVNSIYELRKDMPASGFDLLPIVGQVHCEQEIKFMPTRSIIFMLKKTHGFSVI